MLDNGPNCIIIVIIIITLLATRTNTGNAVK